MITVYPTPYDRKDWQENIIRDNKNLYNKLYSLYKKMVLFLLKKIKTIYIKC